MKKLKSLLYIIPICLGLTLPLLVSNKAINVKAENFEYGGSLHTDMEVQNLGYTYEVSIDVNNTSDLDSLEYPASVGYTIEYDADYINYYGYEEYFYLNLVNEKTNNTYVFYDNDTYFTFYPGDTYSDSYLRLSFNGISYNNDTFEFEESSIVYVFDDADSDYNDIGNAYTMYSLAKLLIDDFDYSINDLFNSWFDGITSIVDTSYSYYQNLNFPVGFYSHDYFNQPSVVIDELQQNVLDLQDDYDMLENNYYDSVAELEELQSDYNELSDLYESELIVSNQWFNERNEYLVLSVQLQDALDSKTIAYNQMVDNYEAELQIQYDSFILLTQQYNDLNSQYQSKTAITDTFTLFKTSFNSLIPIMEIELLPNITIGMLITIPFVVAVVTLLFRMLS